MDIPIARADGCTCANTTSLAAAGKWPCSAAWILLDLQAHPTPWALLSYPFPPPGHAPWLAESHTAGCHLRQGQRSQCLPASHTSSNIDTAPLDCHCWHLMYSFRCSCFNFEGSMRDRRKCICPVNVLETARGERQGCQIPISSFLGIAQLRGWRPGF